MKKVMDKVKQALLLKKGNRNQNDENNQNKEEKIRPKEITHLIFVRFIKILF